jgi:hypothetical protein
MNAPEPIPFDPPAAGAWLRCRWLPRVAVGRSKPRLVPEWDGCWHIFSGEVQAGARRGEIKGRARCGLRMRMRDFSLFDGSRLSDFVVADEQPTVDTCRACIRMTLAR